MDISAINGTSFKLPIVHPATNKAIGLTIEIVGPHDDRFKAVERNITNKVMQKRARGKTLTADEIEGNRSDLISSIVLSWEWTNDADGKPGNFGGEQLKFNPASLEKVLSIVWIKNQIDEALAETSNFFRG